MQNLSFYEYLLECLQEECAEVIQAVSKITRFGRDGKYSDGTPNLIKLEREVADVMAIIQMMSNQGWFAINPEDIIWKSVKVEGYWKAYQKLFPPSPRLTGGE
jgi:NTP pyrophosphatase (non-canonical NTP hydrolase)